MRLLRALLLAAAGHRLGVYEILGPLGAGGMGEVYRARDTASAAMSPSGSSLPARNPDYLARFANIAAIYGLEEGAIVMELVPGDTLAHPPDGRYLAYQSNESGHYEVYVRTFPDPGGGKWHVSRGRAGQPRWSSDGRKIFYLNGGRTMTEVAVQLRPTFQAAPPEETFVAPVPGSYTGVPGLFYEDAPALAPGRLIAVLNADTNAPVTVVENWRAKLGR